MWAERYYALIIQELPQFCGGCITFDDFVHRLAIEFLDRYSNDDISFYPADTMEYKAPLNTIDFCEEAYEHGFSAIINDGKLLGFRREKNEEK